MDNGLTIKEWEDFLQEAMEKNVFTDALMSLEKNVNSMIALYNFCNKTQDVEAFIFLLDRELFGEDFYNYSPKSFYQLVFQGRELYDLNPERQVYQFERAKKNIAAAKRTIKVEVMPMNSELMSREEIESIDFENVKCVIEHDDSLRICFDFVLNDCFDVAFKFLIAIKDSDNNNLCWDVSIPYLILDGEGIYEIDFYSFVLNEGIETDKVSNVIILPYA